MSAFISMDPRTTYPYPFENITAAGFDIIDLTSRGMRSKRIAETLLTKDSFIRKIRGDITRVTGARTAASMVYRACQVDLFPSQLEQTYPPDELSPARLEALALAAQGLTIREISDVAGRVSETGVQIYRARQDLGAVTTPHAVRLAFESGLLPPDLEIFH